MPLYTVFLSFLWLSHFNYFLFCRSCTHITHIQPNRHAQPVGLIIPPPSSTFVSFKDNITGEEWIELSKSTSSHRPYRYNDIDSFGQVDCFYYVGWFLLEVLLVYSYAWSSSACICIVIVFSCLQDTKTCPETNNNGSQKLWKHT